MTILGNFGCFGRKCFRSHLGLLAPGPTCRRNPAENFLLEKNILADQNPQGWIPSGVMQPVKLTIGGGLEDQNYLLVMTDTYLMIIELHVRLCLLFFMERMTVNDCQK